MKNKYLASLVRAIDGISTSDVKFKYALAKNRKMLLSEIEVLQEAVKPTEEFMKYETERVELAKKMADKDVKGNPVIEGNAYKFSDVGKFEKELEKVKSKHKKAVEAREKQNKDFTELLDKESDFTPHKIKLENTPKELTPAQLSEIIDLIDAGNAGNLTGTKDDPNPPQSKNAI